MKPESWIAIGSACVTAVLTGVGLYFGPRLAVKQAIKQFQIQKRWEEQNKVYTTILDALSVIQHVNEDRYGQLAAGQDPIFISDLKKAELDKADFELSKYTAQGPHLISPAAAAALKHFQEEQCHDEGTELVQMFEEEAEAAARCIAIISGEAKTI
jgi:hypothetical protein